MVVGSKGPAAPTGPESPAGPIDDKAHRPSKRGPGRQLLVPATVEAAGMESLGLDSRILETVQALGIETFTEPQERAIPRILAGANVLLVAPTGIGKTEAALLPILDRILRDKPEPTSCLYITPLRALNRDMLRRMTFFADRLGVRVAVRHGDTTPQERAAITRHPPDILITTPETFQILFTGRQLREHLPSVRYIVVDEIHQLASDGRGAPPMLRVDQGAPVDLVLREHTRHGGVPVVAAGGVVPGSEDWRAPRESLERRARPDGRRVQIGRPPSPRVHLLPGTRNRCGDRRLRLAVQLSPRGLAARAANRAIRAWGRRSLGWRHLCHPRGRRRGGVCDRPSGPPGGDRGSRRPGRQSLGPRQPACRARGVRAVRLAR